MTDSPSPDDRTFSEKSTYSRWRNKLFIYWLLVIAALILLIFLIKNRHPAHDKDKPAPGVVLTTVKKKNVPVYIAALGNVVATNTVTVKTQVNGLLMKVAFKEGQLVKKGDLLAEIDNRPLLAQLTQYQGQLTRDEALLANALIDLKRYQVLWKQDSVSQQTLATQESLVKQYQGNVQVDKGFIKSTEVNLIYTRITSPVDGRVGLRLVDAGNVVQTTDTTGIVVITTLHPITVIFSIAEDYIPALLPQVFAHQKIMVQAYDRRQNSLLATGTLLTIDNQINTSTGTVKLRAEFDNKDNKLFSNQFVNIKLLQNELPAAIVVSTAAIQHGSRGDFVYLIKTDSTVATQAVTAGITSGDDTVIEQGLDVGQQVVVDGADKLTNGSKVTVAANKAAFEHAIKKQTRSI